MLIGDIGDGISQSLKYAGEKNVILIFYNFALSLS